MIFEVTYLDATGAPVLIATFNADTPRDALGHMLTVPSLAPPPGTEKIEVRIIPP